MILLDEEFRKLTSRGVEEMGAAETSAAVETLEQRYLGRKGFLAALIRKLETAPRELKSRFGKAANEAKVALTAAAREAKTRTSERATDATFDPTLPGLPVRAGHLHPLTQTVRRVVDTFRSMGFEVVEGPEAERTRYNFDLLNIGRDHPSRDVMDTFYLDGGDGRVLRTHTSPVQLRAMEKRKPPVRLIAPGRVFRHEATDASHEAMFFQCEGLVIDRRVRLTDLFGTLTQFFSAFFERDVVTRPRASYFPFVEPGAELEMRCLVCGGKGCAVCGHTGWLEMLGCGMVHPTVLMNMEVDPKEFSGFAFGMGLDRLMMLRHGINDVRLTTSGGLSFLEQF